RGGSDLSALFVAHCLQARCRLVKDVDGVYDRDPQLPGGARRFGSLSWERALQVAGKVIQARALQFAQQWQQCFEVSRVGAVGATRVGPGPDEYALTPSASGPRRVNLR